MGRKKGDGRWESPIKTAEFPNPATIVAGNIDTVITEENEIWQGFLDGDYINGKAERIIP